MTHQSDKGKSISTKLKFSGPKGLGEQFEAEVNVPHLFNDSLSSSVIDNGIIIPDGLPFDWGKNGGILDCQLNYVEDSAFHEGIGGGEVDKSQFNSNSVENSDKKCIFIGQICPVWGHVFTDDIKRLWFFDTQKCKDLLSEGYQVVYTTMGNNQLPHYIIDLFKLAGFDINSCNRISKPTRFMSIVLPECSIRKKRERNIGVRLFHPLYVDCIHRICQTVDNLNYHCLSFDKVYLTRSNFTGSHKDFNESELERFYSKQGYQIISPESMSVEQQIYMIRHTSHLVTTDGSVGHSSIFCNPSTKIVILLKANYVNPYQTCISDVFGLDISYVYSHHSFWANRKHPSNGPFYLCVTKYMSNRTVPAFLKVSYWKYLI